MSTLKDIAKAANVSVSTASKALSGNPEISPETADSVIQAAKKLHYKPKNPPRPHHLSRSMNGAIGLICPELTSNYYAQLVNTLSENIISAGFCVMLGISNFLPQQEEMLLEQFIGYADGIIFVTETENISWLERRKKTSNVPLVMVSSWKNPENLVDTVFINERYGVETAVRYLLEMGHRKIAFIGDRLSEARYRVYSDILKSCRITERKEYVFMSDKRFEEAGMEAMDALLKNAEQPSAVVAAYDDIAIGAMHAISEAHLKVPENISIIGYDNIHISEYLPVRLSTVSMPVQSAAKLAVDIITMKITQKDNKIIHNLELKPALEIRDSVRNL